MIPAFCARCRHDTGRVAVLRPVDTSPDPRRVDPYRVLHTRAVKREVHSLVPDSDATGRNAVLERILLDLSYAITITRRDGSTYEKRISKGRAYRMKRDAGHITLRCPKCEIRMELDEPLVVSPYVIALPRIEGCLVCKDEDDEGRMNCRACDGRGWIVKGQDFVSVDLACSACVAEMRGGRGPSYTTPNHTGEPGNPRKGSSMAVGKSGTMCVKCQMRAASAKTRVCARCAEATRELTPLEAAKRELHQIRDARKGRSIGR